MREFVFSNYRHPGSSAREVGFGRLLQSVVSADKPDNADKPDEPEPGSIDDLINGLIDNQPNQSSQFLEDWSPDAVGHHDWATFSMTGLSWVVIIVIVSVCLKRAFAVPMDLVPEVLGVGAIPPAADG